MKTVKLPKGKTFEFKKSGGSASKYPWDAMFSGDLVQITKGEDYTVATDAMGPKIKTAARRRYKVCSVSTRDFEGNKLTDSLILQARDMTPEERTAEDAKRAEEKIKNAERRAEEKAAGTTAEPAAA